MRICVFCGSSAGKGPGYLAAAEAVGATLAARGIGLVYGGASVGTMGAVADAALAAGGEVVGVIPQSLVDREVAHHGLTELHVVADLHERKAKMATLADAFLALPGGAGTLEELFEVYTWAQLGLHAKPIALLDVAGYYQPMLRFLDHMVDEGFLASTYREMLLVETDPNRVVDRYATVVRAPGKWDQNHAG
ncbi:LOG family protein [Actinophytocola xanthii]|uniref:Cytokinin riboside 5'-monophosphate phosphoribohydrolase n=1 Tax=Actinophytocola xanthii TaxID=1912961 RepID=A0A1Q8CYZ4_9PSEU|nr:TIGR00730 family Rossman fold protein [Actinophytocola xanthii]OLF19579.1 Rossman fold protein, TIGR00730 family [Actinophytocola xanthii]